MGRRVPRDMTVEEFDDWSKAGRKIEEIGHAADEVSGPRLSLVPLPTRRAENRSVTANIREDWAQPIR